MVIRHIMASSIIGCLLIGMSVATAQDIVLTDDFTGGLNLPWVFIDNFGNVPPESTDVISNDADQNLKLIGSSMAYEESMDFSESTTAYAGLGDNDFFFENEVHVSATFSQLRNTTLGFEENVQANNDLFIVARGEGLTGYVFALDTFHAEADLVRVDDGTVVGLGDDSILRDLAGIDEEGSYTLTLSAIDNVLTGRVFDDQMELLGEISIEEDTYADGWAGVGTAINDAGDEANRTLIAASFDNFVASNTLDINVEPPTIDELTAAINNGLTDSRFDINGNGTVDAEDREAWVTVSANTYFGDADLNGEFNSGDFVVVFTAGEYEDETVGNSFVGGRRLEWRRRL